jgi:ferrous iron transport protein B
VDITRGKRRIGEHHEVEFIDTPGFYSLTTITEEENVTKRLLIEESPDVVLHVIDAKNIERMLPLTLQLIEAGFPVILVLNMFDELKHRGMDIQTAHLEHDLGIPVVATVATKGEGIENLISRIVSVCEKRYNFQRIRLVHTQSVETLIDNIGDLITGDYNINKRMLAALFLQRDPDVIELLRHEKNFELMMNICSHHDPNTMKLEIARSFHEIARNIVSENISKKDSISENSIKSVIDKITMNPVSGLIAVFIILYVGFYKFVGEFGAGVVVDFIENNIFENIVNPYVNSFFHSLLGSSIFFDLFAGDYGVITLGLKYAIAIVLPVVFLYFLMFSLLEDSGYLVRLAMVLDRFLKKVGLSGRSVIPLVLGLGCGTMATVVTRTLETVRERYIVTFLLALTVPCAAQLGVILALLVVSFTYLIVWFISIVIVFALSGVVLNKYVKGSPAPFLMEMPPLRMPIPGNVLIKTFARLKWYAFEVIPVFIYISVFIWVGKITRIFDILTLILAYPARWAGLPDKMGEIFLYGFFRRDFGAAGLYDLQHILTPTQIVVSAVTLTLFVPCVAQFSVMIKERGKRDAIFIFVFVTLFAFSFGILLNLILSWWGF